MYVLRVNSHGSGSLHVPKEVVNKVMNDNITMYYECKYVNGAIMFEPVAQVQEPITDEEFFAKYDPGW